MYGPDEENITFVILQGLYCYRVMPFGMKNAITTYQRLVTKMFKHLIGKMVEVYIDDMVMKSKEPSDYLVDLKEVFEILKAFRLGLNVRQIFGTLGHNKRNRGWSRPNQIKAIFDLESPKIAKEVQILIGKVVTLNRFICQSSDKCKPFF